MDFNRHGLCEGVDGGTGAVVRNEMPDARVERFIPFCPDEHRIVGGVDQPQLNLNRPIRRCGVVTAR